LRVKLAFVLGRTHHHRHNGNDTLVDSAHHPGRPSALRGTGNNELVVLPTPDQKKKKKKKRSQQRLKLLVL
jgi:hypothetical protein